MSAYASVQRDRALSQTNLRNHPCDILARNPVVQEDVTCLCVDALPVGVLRNLGLCGESIMISVRSGNIHVPSLAR